MIVLSQIPTRAVKLSQEVWMKICQGYFLSNTMA